jgi:hypothetical protein
LENAAIGNSFDLGHAGGVEKGTIARERAVRDAVLDDEVLEEV